MPATFPLDFMDLAMFISPIRPGIEGLGGADKTPACGEAACFDMSIDDNCGHVGLEKFARLTALTFCLHETRKGAEIEGLH